MKIIEYANVKEEFYSYREISDVESVQSIIDDVRKFGDKAVREYTEKFDKINIGTIQVIDKEMGHAKEAAGYDTIESIRQAADYIKKFAKRQIAQISNFEFEITPGVFLGQRVKPVERVGIYAPGGRFPLISSVLMCAIPAQVAGVENIYLCSPPRFKGTIHPSILVAAQMCKVSAVYRIGGVQAIAAMAFGTETIKPVDIIVGPGNKYVTQAKRLVYGRIGIDFIAGPTEVLIIADESANPEIIAADLLAQAEHDIEAEAVLVTTSKTLAKQVIEEVDRQLEQLTTHEIASKSIKKRGKIILVGNLDQAVKLANKKAPEHIEVHLKKWQNLTPRLKHFGSLFIGEQAGEVLGDYSSGLNHTLPTNGSARYTGGLNVLDFMRLQTSLRVETEGLKKIGPIAKKLAELEGLDGHMRAISIRNKMYTQPPSNSL